MPFISDLVLNDSRRLIIGGGEGIHQGLINLLQAEPFDENTLNTSDYIQLYNSTINSLKNNPYIALALPQNCTTKQIRTKYIHLAKLCHPDKLSNSNELFYIIKDAYELLSDLNKRQEYDLISKQNSPSSLQTSLSFTSPRVNNNKTNQNLNSNSTNSSSHHNFYSYSNSTNNNYNYNNSNNNINENINDNYSINYQTPRKKTPRIPKSTTPRTTITTPRNEYNNNKKKATTLPRSSSHPYQYIIKTTPIKLNKLKSKKAFKSMEHLYGSIHSKPDRLSRDMNKEINTSYDDITTLMPPSNFHHVKITSNTIQLIWDNQNDLYSNINIVYELYWREVDIESSTPNDWQRGSKYINGTICIKRNLSPSTFYQFRLRSKYKYIFSPFSNILTIETKSDSSFLGDKINDTDHIELQQKKSNEYQQKYQTNNNNNYQQQRQRQHQQHLQQNNNDMELEDTHNFHIRNFRRQDNEYDDETYIQRSINGYGCDKLNEKSCLSRSIYCLFCTVLAWIVFYFLLQGMIECHKDQRDSGGQPVEDNCEVDQWVVSLITVILYFISCILIISFIVLIIVILKQCFNICEPSNNRRRVSNI